MVVKSVEFQAVALAQATKRRSCLLSTSALAILAGVWAGSASAQCVGPDMNHVVNCPPGAYLGINYGASDPGITINVAAGVTVTTEGVTANGSGNITINGDP